MVFIIFLLIGFGTSCYGGGWDGVEGGVEGAVYDEWVFRCFHPFVGLRCV